jgi:hypothetical protein
MTRRTEQNVLKALGFFAVASPATILVLVLWLVP